MVRVFKSQIYLLFLEFRFLYCRTFNKVMRRIKAIYFSVIKPHEHHFNDGRGPRRVFLDGAEIKKAVFVNTKTGEVEYYSDPIEIDRIRGELVTHKTKGAEVRIEWLKP